MTEIKTTRNQADPIAFVNSVADKVRREDARQLLRIMSEATGEPPAMWGTSIVGFGTQKYRYASGREADWMKIGFSPRKAELVLYGLVYYDETVENNKLLDTLGPHRRGKGCLYVRSLNTIDIDVLRQMIGVASKK